MTRSGFATVQAERSTTRLPAARLPPMWRLAFERVPRLFLRHCRRLRAFTASRTCSSTPQSAEPPAASWQEGAGAASFRAFERKVGKRSSRPSRGTETSSQIGGLDDKSGKT